MAGNVILLAVYCCRKLNSGSPTVPGALTDVSMVELVVVVAAVAARERLGKKLRELFPVEAVFSKLSVLTVARFCKQSLLMFSVKCGLDSTGGTVAEMIWYLKLCTKAAACHNHQASQKAHSCS